MNRRKFLAVVTGGVAVASGVTQVALPACASESAAGRPDEQIGVLVDTTTCIGCRKCEYACARANRPEGVSVKQFDDMSVLDTPRRMTELVTWLKEQDFMKSYK